jgi:cephalosporin hydroxylase
MPDETDRLNFAEIAARYPTDRAHHYYHLVYEELYGDRRNEVESVLEVGVLKGGGLMSFADYFPNATIYGMDIDLDRISCVPQDYLDNDRIILIPGDSTVTRIIEPYSFDIIIDDGSHKYHDQLATFQNLYPRLNAGGLYSIEDVEPDTPDDFFDKLGVPYEIRDQRKYSHKQDSRIAIIQRGTREYGRPEP